MATYRVLIASSDPWTARAVAIDLAREGYEMAVARSVGEAARLNRYFHPDLVIVDYPLLNTGLEVRPADVPLLVLTPRDCHLDELPGLRPEMDDYLTKPFSPAELGLWVEAVLLRRSFMIDPTGARNSSPVRAEGPLRERGDQPAGRKSGFPWKPGFARLQFSSC